MYLKSSGAWPTIAVCLLTYASGCGASRQQAAQSNADSKAGKQDVAKDGLITGPSASTATLGSIEATTANDVPASPPASEQAQAEPEKTVTPRPEWLEVAKWPALKVLQDSASIVTGDRTAWALMMELDQKKYNPDSCANLVKKQLAPVFTSIEVSDGEGGRKVIDGRTSTWVLKAMCGYNPKKELLLYLAASEP